MNSISSYLNQPGRVLQMDGAYNVRDLGGYPAADGKSVKWGHLFRSGDLDLLTDYDLERLSAAKLKTIIDFREDKEVEDAPDRVPASVTHPIRLPVVMGSMKDVLKQKEKPDGRVVMPWMNERLAKDFQDVYTRFMSIVADKESAPLLFHCTAGKDRTGFGAMLILSALGVDREIIMADYMLSNEYVMKKYATLIEERPFMYSLIRVEPEYLNTAYKVIDEQYGGVEKYLVNNLKADIPKLRKLYTE